MAENPYMKLYGRDYLASTRHLTCAARGAYVDLLILAWFDGGLPIEPETLRRMVGAEAKDWRAIWPQLASKWPVADDGRRRNPRQESERVKALIVSSRRSESGKAGATARATTPGKQTPSKSEANGQAKDKQIGKQTPSKSEANGLANGQLSVAVAVAETTVAERDTRSGGVEDPGARVDPPPMATTGTDYGPSPTRRRKAHVAWEAQRECLDVPHMLWAELLSGMTNPDEVVLRAWLADTEAAWAGRSIGDTTWDFWRARKREWQGTTVTPAAKPSVAAHNARMLAELEAREAAGRIPSLTTARTQAHQGVDGGAPARVAPGASGAVTGLEARRG